MYPKSAQSWRYPLCLLAAFAAIWLALAIHPVFRKDWLLENMIVFVAVPALVALTARRLRFSNFAYTCLFVFFAAARDRRALHVLARALRATGWQALGRRRARRAQPLRPLRTLHYGACSCCPPRRSVRARMVRRAAVALPDAGVLHAGALGGLRADRVSRRRSSSAATSGRPTSARRATCGTARRTWRSRSRARHSRSSCSPPADACQSGAREKMSRQPPARNRVVLAARGESGGLEGERRRAAAALARTLDLDRATPEGPLRVRDDGQRRAPRRVRSGRRRAPFQLLNRVHGE